MSHTTNYYVTIIGRPFGRMQALCAHRLELILGLQHVFNALS